VSFRQISFEGGKETNKRAKSKRRRKMVRENERDKKIKIRCKKYCVWWWRLKGKEKLDKGTGNGSWTEN
jgi:hypothetical protein